jgi:hypothetical protein
MQQSDFNTMNTQAPTRNRINTLLIVFVLINIIGDMGNVIVWLAFPDMRGSLTGGVMGGTQLTGGYIAVTAGADAALIAGSVILIAVSIVYIAALFGMMKRRTWAPRLVIAISVANRLLALLLFQFNEAFAFWGAWTVILVVVAALDYRKISATTVTASAPTSQT